MDALFLPLANLVGASVDQIKLIFCLLVAYPLGSLFIRIPSNKPALKHLFSIGISIFFFFPVLKIYSAYFQLLASIVGTYFIAKFDQSRRMPWIVFAFVMGHLTVNHVIRAWFEFSYETMEVTGPQMVLTMKLTTFAWNVWDGRRPAEDLDKWQMAKRIQKYPSLLEFLGYAFYFPGILVGPYLDFAEYKDLIDESLFKDPKVLEKSRSGRTIPDGRKRVAYLKMFMGLVYLGIFVVLGGSHNFSTTLEPWFAKKDLLTRIALFQIYGPLERSKYYAIWTLTEGASILTGLGFTGFSPSGSSTWNGAANVKVMDIEFPSNFKVLLDSWNMKTNIWLRECVYKRVTPKGQKPGSMSSMLTFLTSAFWHGIAGGYYLTFLMGGFITTAARLARANFRPLVLPPAGQETSSTKRIYDLLATLISVIILNYTAAPFMLLTVKNSLYSWGLLGWYGHAIIGGALLFFYAGGTAFCRGLQAKRGLLPPKSKSNGNGTATPVSEKNFMIPPSIDRLAPSQK
ncbi:MBOAT-domain-containing protein [Pluteus cervinus]|uniref:MBOAT-domain-containing protein n=1 Tax=Pluteus cervinus TaxID=181527 RepID=A0ACD3B9G0_9AGAR|nr:MBOAT-domain-containing protein [Pluteus cervinus]